MLQPNWAGMHKRSYGCLVLKPVRVEQAKYLGIALDVWLIFMDDTISSAFAY